MTFRNKDNLKTKTRSFMWRLGLEISVYNRQFMDPMKLSPDKTTVGYDNKIKMMKTRPRKLAA